LLVVFMRIISESDHHTFLKHGICYYSICWRSVMLIWMSWQSVILCFIRKEKTESHQEWRMRQWVQWRPGTSTEMNLLTCHSACHIRRNRRAWTKFRVLKRISSTTSQKAQSLTPRGLKWHLTLAQVYVFVYYYC